MRRLLSLLSVLVVAGLAFGPALAKKDKQPVIDPAAQAAAEAGVETEAEPAADATAEELIEEMVDVEPAVKLQSDILARFPEVAEAIAAVEANPSDAEAWRVLGVRLTNRAGFKDAIKALREATELDGTSVAAWNDLGTALIRSGNVGSGMSAIRRALKIEPFSAVAHYNLGIGYQAQGNYDSAMQSFETALLLDPSLADVKRNPGALTNPALPYVQLGVYMKREGAAPALFMEQAPQEGLVPDAPPAAEPAAK
ncbi:MAG: tetratricopeptide repeat protein [Acidobacteria bacterium]|jgi:Flp pilus assembly protein TadD|nr:tetratricopeptide repeat protein [Acidobacteriota bacterium]